MITESQSAICLDIDFPGQGKFSAEITKLVPGSTAPSVLPLSKPGMVAVHALVPAAEVWRLLPQLEAAGGSSILLVPIERMLA